jgi:hypothetical protein
MPATLDGAPPAALRIASASPGLVPGSSAGSDENSSGPFCAKTRTRAITPAASTPFRSWFRSLVAVASGSGFARLAPSTIGAIVCRTTADALLSWASTFDVRAVFCMNDAPAMRRPHATTSTAKSGHLEPLRSSVPMIILVPRVDAGTRGRLPCCVLRRMRGRPEPPG